MFVVLRAMKPYVPRKNHRLCSSDGTIASGFVEEQEIAKQHFAGVLVCIVRSKAELIKLDRIEAAERAVTLNSVEELLSVAPTKTFLVRRYNSSSMRKALGEAGVGAEVRKMCHAASSQSMLICQISY